MTISNHEYVYVWMVGFLASMFCYHFAIFTLNRRKEYLFYSLFTFMQMFYFMSKAETSSLYVNYFEPILGYFNWTVQIVFYILYQFFLLHFLELRKHSRTLYSILIFNVSVGFLLILLSIILHVGDQPAFYEFTTNAFNLVYVPILFVGNVLLFVYMALGRIEPRKFLIIGLTCFTVLALVAMYAGIKEVYILGVDGMVFYSIGVVIEAMCFALGLGYKYRQLQKSSAKAKEDTIRQLEENRTIKEQLNELLIKEIEHKQAELGSLSERFAVNEMEKADLHYTNELNQLQMKNLRNQMNPHFVFNSLNSIKAYLIDQDTPKAINYLNRFSKFIRKALDATTMDSITLKEEIDYLKLYVALENERFDNDIMLDINVEQPDVWHKVELPPLLLQPIIENSIKHGFKNNKKNAKITITCREEESVFTIQVEDNGFGFTESQSMSWHKLERKSFGMDLVKNRLKYSYPSAEEPGPTVETIAKSPPDFETTGVITILTLPKRKSEVVVGDDEANVINLH